MSRHIPTEFTVAGGANVPPYPCCHSTPNSSDSAQMGSFIFRTALLLLLIPIAAHAQSGSPFDTGFTALQNLFTGTVAKVASLIAIVIGGYGSRTANPAQRRLSPVSPPERALPFSQ